MNRRTVSTNWLDGFSPFALNLRHDTNPGAPRPPQGPRATPAYATAACAKAACATPACATPACAMQLKRRLHVQPPELHVQPTLHRSLPQKHKNRRDGVPEDHQRWQLCSRFDAPCAAQCGLPPRTGLPQRRPSFHLLRRRVRRARRPVSSGASRHKHFGLCWSQTGHSR
eukprot:scaffold242_cov68-Phaeocystis_antarctica.AAC.1